MGGCLYESYRNDKYLNCFCNVGLKITKSGGEGAKLFLTCLLKPIFLPFGYGMLFVWDLFGMTNTSCHFWSQNCDEDAKPGKSNRAIRFPWLSYLYKYSQMKPPLAVNFLAFWEWELFRMTLNVTTDSIWPWMASALLSKKTFDRDERSNKHIGA